LIFRKKGKGGREEGRRKEGGINRVQSFSEGWQSEGSLGCPPGSNDPPPKRDDGKESLHQLGLQGLRKRFAKRLDLERIVEGWMRILDVELIVQFPESFSEGEGLVVKFHVLFDEVDKLFRGGDLIRAILVDAGDLLGGIVIQGIVDNVLMKMVFCAFSVLTKLEEFPFPIVSEKVSHANVFQTTSLKPRKYLATNLDCSPQEKGETDLGCKELGSGLKFLFLFFGGLFGFFCLDLLGSEEGKEVLVVVDEGSRREEDCP
jgi:hypothetical protein